MSDPDRGAYTPPTDAPLSFDARQPVRGGGPAPVMLIVSALVLLALVVAIFMFYRSGVCEAGQPPQTVGEPIAEMKAAQNEAKVWLYQLMWNTPVFDGMLRSPHSLDLPLIFDIAMGERWKPYTGAVPAALGLGPGAETRAPMARGIIGGIILSTLVTLVLVPVFYVLIERLRGASGCLLAAPEGRD